MENPSDTRMMMLFTPLLSPLLEEKNSSLAKRRARPVSVRPP